MTTRLRNTGRRLWFASGVVQVTAALVLSACIAETDRGPQSPQNEQRAIIDPATLNTFISEYLEIDQLNEMPPEDANLFTGLDPADLSLSAKKPGPGSGPYIDWHDLGGDLANHQVLDLDAPGTNKDESSFPRSDECVGRSTVLSKMDLVYIAAANNNEFGYFAVARANNNGDAAYYWLFTKKEPKRLEGADPCKSDEYRLLYDISGPDPDTGATGDVLLKGHFHPGTTPLLEVYQATGDMDDVPAVDAIDYLSGLWALNPSGVAAVAVNTTDTDPGALGAQGVLAVTDDGDLEPKIFAEAAVPISIFTGGSACGASYWASVITRSSGSGGTSPDPKDLVGPMVINFGSVEATAVLTPTCGLQVGFEATAKGPDGSPLVGAECFWSFDDGATAEVCSGTITLTPGTRTATVYVRDPVSECEDDAEPAPLDVYNELSVSANFTPTCLSRFGYSAVASGGSDPANVSYAWTFYGEGSVSPASSSSASGEVMVGTGAVWYFGDVTVTDPRTDLVCTDTTSASTMPYAPLAVSLTLGTTVEECPNLSTDEVTYHALAGGGNGAYSYTWSGVSCSGDQCSVSASEELCNQQSLFVTLSDTSGLCPPIASETETYQKVTIIQASDN